MNWLRRLISRRLPLSALIPACGLSALLILSFGSPPQALGLESWTAVLSWDFLHHLQWGPDIVFTYGPLGFLEPYTWYVPGIFWWFTGGQILLVAAFAVTVGLLFHRSSIGQFGLFALLLVCWSSRLEGDVSWALTLLFGTTYLTNDRDRPDTLSFFVSVIVLAPLFGVIGLVKFSLLPLWALCVATVSVINLSRRRFSRAAICVFAFPAALALVWIVCSQNLSSFPSFLMRSYDVASGYGHAMGTSAPPAVEIAALIGLGIFLSTCAYAGWSKRKDPPAVVTLALVAATAVLFGMAFLIRGDHWPWFFPAISFLLVVLLRNTHLNGVRFLRLILITGIMAGIAAALVMKSPGVIAAESVSQIRSSVYYLHHLEDLAKIRKSEWRALSRRNDLLKIRKWVGRSSIDVLTWQQGIILVNKFNYAPRPVFQSYSAYTPTLARLNESYFLGPHAPRFVALALDTIDNRLPMSEDGLALIALLRHYRPVLVDRMFLLLQHDLSLPSTEPMRETGNPAIATLGTPVSINETQQPIIAFINVHLTLLGKIYTLLFREPPLRITVTLSDGQSQPYRLVRPTAASGFLISPFIRSTDDWIKLYFSKQLPHVRSIVVEATSAWDRLFFSRSYTTDFQPANVLQVNEAEITPALAGALLYPGFNIKPTKPSNLRVFDENGHRAVFLQSPGSIEFAPSSGRYHVTATVGIQDIALHEADCIAARPDGIGVSLIVHHDNVANVVWHEEIDPFHSQKDIGPHKLDAQRVEVRDGDTVEYRVDPGHHGTNTSCDWSYVRDFKFVHETDGPPPSPDTVFRGFNVAPIAPHLRVIVNDGFPAIFLCTHLRRFNSAPSLGASASLHPSACNPSRGKIGDASRPARMASAYH